MRDVDDAGAGCAQTPNDLEKALDLAVGKRGGGLVHHDDARGSRQDLGDFDQLLVSYRESRDRYVEWNLQPELVKRACGTIAQLRRVDEAGAGRFRAECDVGGGGELRHERK